MKADPRDRHQSPSVLVAIDASGGNFYDLGAFSATRAQVLDAMLPDGVPYASDRGQALFDPRCWRLHDLNRVLPNGAQDQRLSIQVVLDEDGPYDEPREGDAPLGQPELFTSLNRSTRYADPEGRVALPTSLLRLVGAEDDRYALALSLSHLPMDPIPHEEDGDQGGTRTAEDAAKDRHKVAPRVEFGPPGTGFATAAGGVAGRRKRPLGYFTDEWGEAAHLGAVLTASLGPALYRGREATAHRLGAIRVDAHFASAGPNIAGAPAPGLTGPILFDARDASGIPDNDFGADFAAAVDAAIAEGGGTGGVVNPPKRVKGSMWFDRSAAGSGASPSGLGRGGVWVPVLVVTADDVGAKDKEKKPPQPPKPPKPPQPPPPGGPGGIIGAGGSGGGPSGPGSAFTGGAGDSSQPGASGFDPGTVGDRGPGSGGFLLGPDRSTQGTGTGFNFDPLFGFTPRPIGSPWLFGGGDIGGVGGNGVGQDSGGGTPTTSTPGASGGSSTPIQDQIDDIIEDGVGELQDRDYEGQGVPCPNTILTPGLNDGFSQVQQTDSTHVQVGDVEVEIVPEQNIQQEVPSDLLGGGGKTIANVLIPPPGSPGGPATVGDYLAIQSRQQRALAAIIRGAFAGPGFFGGNIGVQHINSPTNPPAPSRIGAHWTAQPGQQLVVNRPVTEVVSVLEAGPGAQLEAAGGGLFDVRRELRGDGTIVDKRPLIYLDQGDRGKGNNLAADLISDRERHFKVGADRAVSGQAVNILLDPEEPRPTYPLQIAMWDKQTGNALGGPTWAVTPDGVSFVQDLTDVPSAPPDGLMAIYSRGGQVYKQTSAGVESALGVAGGGIIIQEEDGTPTGTPTTLKFPNGSLTDNGDGTFSASTGSGLSNPVTVAQGGTGSTTAANARTALGLAIGTNVQAWDAQLDDFAGLAPTKGRVLVGNGTNWVAVTVGTDGQVITADSAEANGLKWATPGAGGLGDPVTVAHGGTNATTESGARTNLGLAIGVDIQAWDQNLQDFAGLVPAADRMVYFNGAGALVVGTYSAAVDDFNGLSGAGEAWHWRTGSAWATPTATANSTPGTNTSGTITQMAASTKKFLTRGTGGLAYSGDMNLETASVVGSAELASTGHATTGSFQLNLDMQTTSTAAGGAETALALQADNATQNKFKIRNDGASGWDILIRNISGATSNHYFDVSANVWEFGAALRLLHQAAPSTPSAGATVVYGKTSGPLVTWKGSAGVENTGVVPQTAPTASTTYSDSMVTGSGWADATAQTDFNAAVSRFNDFVTNGYNSQAITGGVNAHRTANLGAGTYV